MKPKVFLGGTCNGSTWREQLKPLLNIEYFDPVVPDWTKEAQEEELRQRRECQLILYTITPKMKGVYSIAEAVDDSNKRPKSTIVMLLPNGDSNDYAEPKFDEAQLKSLLMFMSMVEKNGATIAYSIIDAARILNNIGAKLSKAAE